MTGRPSEFSQDIADEVCARIADGESLRAICEEERLPNRSTIFKWLDKPEHKAFCDQYARAREASADADADDIGHYSREAAAGKIDAAQARCAIDGLKWSAGKRKPKKYGDRHQVALTGEDGGPIRTLDLTNLSDERLQQLETILAEAGSLQPLAGDASA